MRKNFLITLIAVLWGGYAIAATPSPSPSPTPTPCANCLVYQGGHFMNGMGTEQGPAMGSAYWTGAANAAPVYIQVTGGQLVSGFVQRGARGEGVYRIQDPARLPTNQSYIHMHFNVDMNAAPVAMTVMDYEHIGFKIKLEVFGPGHANAGKVQISYSSAIGVVSTLYNYVYAGNDLNDLDAPGNGSIPYGPSRLALSFTACGLRLQVGTGAEPLLTSPGITFPNFAPHLSVTGSFLAYGNNAALGAPLDGWFDDIRLWTCGALPTATPTPSSSCPSCNTFDGVHGYNFSGLGTQYGGPGLGGGSWQGNSGAVPVYMFEDSGYSLTGFMPRGARGEGKLVYGGESLNPTATFLSVWFQVYSGAAPAEMVIADLQRNGYRARISVFGPGHADYGRMKVVYSSVSGLQTAYLNWAYGSGPYNDQSAGGPFSPARQVVGLSLGACGLTVLPGYIDAGTKYLSAAPAGQFYIGYAPHASVTGNSLTFGNDPVLGAPLDGYIDDIRVYRCPGWVALTATPTVLATATATATNTATATPSLPSTPAGSATTSPTPTGTQTTTPVVTAGPTTAVPTATAIPTEIKVHDKRISCRPNYVRGRGGRIRIVARSYRGGQCRLRINRSNGRSLRELWKGYLAAQATHQENWNTTDSQGAEAPSGVYYVIFTDGDGSTQVQKVLIVR